METWAPGADIALEVEGGIEFFVIEGGYSEAGETFETWDWLCLPAGIQIGRHRWTGRHVRLDRRRPSRLASLRDALRLRKVPEREGDMDQATDFLAECDALAAVLDDQPDAIWESETQFKGWTVNDAMVHPTFWNLAAGQALTDPEGFQAATGPVMKGMVQTGLRPVENQAIANRGRDLLLRWQAHYRDMSARWAAVDPKTRVAWVGRDMSARSSIVARRMETWAHGFEILDPLGVARAETDRIRNVVVLGVNTFGRSQKVHGQPISAAMPHLSLTAPSGAIWTFGEPSNAESIGGPAVDFAAAVTQMRTIADASLVFRGPDATTWMAKAQCFVGPPETPPAPGARFRQPATPAPN